MRSELTISPTRHATLPANDSLSDSRFQIAVGVRICRGFRGNAALLFFFCIVSFYPFICPGKLLIMCAQRYTVLLSYSCKHPFHFSLHMPTFPDFTNCEFKLPTWALHFNISSIYIYLYTPKEEQVITKNPHSPRPLPLLPRRPFQIHTWKSQPGLGVCEILHSHSS